MFTVPLGDNVSKKMCGQCLIFAEVFCFLQLRHETQGGGAFAINSLMGIKKGLAEEITLSEPVGAFVTLLLPKNIEISTCDWCQTNFFFSVSQEVTVLRCPQMTKTLITIDISFCGLYWNHHINITTNNSG